MLLLPEAFNLQKNSCTPCVPIFCFKDANAETRDFEGRNLDVHLRQNTHERYSAYDVAWQALHAAAAAACRGSTPTEGRGPRMNFVLSRNSRGPKSCIQLCADTTFAPYCDAEVSIYGYVGKAAANGQEVGLFYNHGCGTAFDSGGEEANAAEEEIMESAEGAFSFCYCGT